MKTVISIPNELYAEAERLVHRLNRSRSDLYADAMREYLARRDPDAVTEALDRVCDLGDSRTDPFVAAVGSHLLERVEW